MLIVGSVYTFVTKAFRRCKMIRNAMLKLMLEGRPMKRIGCVISEREYGLLKTAALLEGHHKIEKYLRNVIRSAIADAVLRGIQEGRVGVEEDKAA